MAREETPDSLRERIEGIVKGMEASDSYGRNSLAFVGLNPILTGALRVLPSDEVAKYLNRAVTACNNSS